jgi:hypothetical protein
MNDQAHGKRQRHLLQDSPLQTRRRAALMLLAEVSHVGSCENGAGCGHAVFLLSKHLVYYTCRIIEVPWLSAVLNLPHRISYHISKLTDSWQCSHFEGMAIHSTGRAHVARHLHFLSQSAGLRSDRLLAEGSQDAW